MHGKIAFFKQNSFAIFCRDKCKIPWVQDRIWVIINVMERVEIKAGTDKKCNSLDFTQRASLFRRRRQTQLDGREREKKSIYIRAY